MGILDLLSPVLTRIDGWLAGWLPPLARVALWGAACAVLSSWIYRRLSPQRRLKRLSEVSAKARRALARYDGTFDGAQHRIRRLLKLSALHFGLTLPPTLVAVLPVLMVLGWVGTTYDYQLPPVGSTVSVQAHPAMAEISWSDGAARSPSPGRWLVTWPPDQAPVRARDRSGAALIALPLSVAVPVVHKRHWYNALLGNPAGYLPARSPVERLELSLPRSSLLPVAIPYLGSAEAPFLLSLLLVSLALRFAWRIR